MKMELLDLISLLPEEWKGLMGAFGRGKCSLAAAEAWLREERGSQYGQNGHYSDLVDSLCTPEPVCEGLVLRFSPLLLHFPIAQQRHLVTFLHRHREDIPTDRLQKLVNMMRDNKISDTGLKLLTELLAQYVRAKRTTEGRTGPRAEGQDEYVFTKDMWKLIVKLVGRVPEHAEGFSQTQDSLHSLDAESQPEVMRIDTPEKSQSWMDSQHGSHAKRLKLDLSQSMDNSGIAESREAGDVPAMTVDSEKMTAVSQLKEIWENSTEKIPETPKEILTLAHCSPQELQTLCNELKLSELSEVALATACQHLASISQELSHANCVCFAKTCLLPKVLGLEQNASRMLTGALIQFAKHFPRPLIEAVLSPCITMEKTESSQADLICQLLKEALNAGHWQLFFRESLAAQIIWNEPVIAIFQLLLDKKTELDPPLMTSLLAGLELNALPLASSLKFGKLILAVITKYGKQLTKNHVAALRQVIECNKTFLKKSALAALNRLKV